MSWDAALKELKSRLSTQDQIGSEPKSILGKKNHSADLKETWYISALITFIFFSWEKKICCLKKKFLTASRVQLKLLRLAWDPCWSGMPSPPLPTRWLILSLSPSQWGLLELSPAPLYPWAELITACSGLQRHHTVIICWLTTLSL